MTRRSKAIRAAWINPYIPFRISTYTQLSSPTRSMMLYWSMISWGNHRNGIFMYSKSSMGLLRKKSLISAVKNFAPGVEMTLLTRSLVSMIEAAGDPASPAYSSLSPPTVSRTR